MIEQKHESSKVITPAEAVTEIVSNFSDETLALKMFSAMWDKGFNSFSKINKAREILVNTYRSGLEEAVNATYSILNNEEPQLPYNPFALKLEFINLMPILGKQDFVREENWEMLRYIKQSDSDYFLCMLNAYNYGFISGKRAERKRRSAK